MKKLKESQLKNINGGSAIEDFWYYFGKGISYVVHSQGNVARHYAPAYASHT